MCVSPDKSVFDSVLPMLMLKQKSLFGFPCAKNNCKIKEFWLHSLQLAELHHILLALLC